MKKQYGYWTFLGIGEPSKDYSARWVMECRCGNVKLVRMQNVIRGQSTNCGCIGMSKFHSSRRTHGRAGTPIYHVWFEMKDRCRNPKNPAWENYGGRGIRVCERWSSFGNFLADMGERPSGKHTLERKDNNGDYRPDNCVWATRGAQAKNKRTNRLIEYKGRTQILADWARELGWGQTKIARRIKRGWSLEETFTKP